MKNIGIHDFYDLKVISYCRFQFDMEAVTETLHLPSKKKTALSSYQQTKSNKVYILVWIVILIILDCHPNNFLPFETQIR